MNGHGVSINPCILHPKSRGKVTLRGTAPQEPIVFTGNNLTGQEDVDALARGIKLSRRIRGAPSMRALGFRELSPGDGDKSAADLEQHARSIAKTVYHPAGTCKMGTDAMAVVDSILRVIGVPRLRHRRCLDHANTGERQYQRALHYDRGTLCRFRFELEASQGDPSSQRGSNAPV